VPLHLSSYSTEEWKSIFRMSDRGSEYTSDRYQAVLREAGIELSMSRTGDRYDNAVMEAFFATLTKEYTDRTRF
jgi:putative transposase